MRASCGCAYRVSAQGRAGGRGGWGIYILNDIHFKGFSSCQGLWPVSTFRPLIPLSTLKYLEADVYILEPRRPVTLV